MKSQGGISIKFFQIGDWIGFSANRNLFEVICFAWYA